LLLLVIKPTPAVSILAAGISPGSRVQVPGFLRQLPDATPIEFFS
jgi:hypothetical protein